MTSHLGGIPLATVTRYTKEGIVLIKFHSTQIRNKELPLYCALKGLPQDRVFSTHREQTPDSGPKFKVFKVQGPPSGHSLQTSTSPAQLMWHRLYPLLSHVGPRNQTPAKGQPVKLTHSRMCQPRDAGGLQKEILCEQSLGGQLGYSSPIWGVP